jgi:hypothetical protein
MCILLHTIVVAPARWTPQKVSQQLLDLIPRLACARFTHLEIFEPHIVLVDEVAIKSSLNDYR